MELSIKPFDSAYFNDLPSIEEADQKLQVEIDLEKALNVIGPVFIKHKVYKTWGISLLHNHWKVGREECPVQEIRKDLLPKEFIIQPKSTTSSKSAIPSVYSIACDDNLGLIPVEYSTDSSAKLANEELKNSPEFISDLKKVLVSNNWDKTFGLIYGRNVTPGYDFVEFNFAERVSLLKEIPSKEVSTMKLIKTSWFFSPDAAGGKCKTKCMGFCDKASGSHERRHSVYHDPNG